MTIVRILEMADGSYEDKEKTRRERAPHRNSPPRVEADPPKVETPPPPPKVETPPKPKVETPPEPKVETPPAP